MKPLTEYPGYFAGSDGNVYSVRARNRFSKPPTEPRQLNTGGGSSGYANVSLYVGESRVSRKVHSLVCEAFHGPRPVGMECCHGPNGRRDNTPENLSWGTHRKNNGEDEVRDGTDNRGEKHGLHKLTSEQVLEIRRLKGHMMHRDIAKRFGVDRATITGICSGKHWRHL